MSLNGDKRSDLAQHTRWLRRRARDLVASDELARDLVQDTIEAYLRRPPTLEHSLRAWLDGALKNQFRMWYRSQWRRTRREAATEEPLAAASPDRQVDRARWSSLVEQALHEVPEPYASTLRMRYFEGLRPADIATRLAIPQSTVRRRNLVGLGLLRQKMEERLGHALDDRHSPLWALLPLMPRAPLTAAKVGGRQRHVALAALAVATLPLLGSRWLPGQMARSARSEAPAVVEAAPPSDLSARDVLPRPEPAPASASASAAREDATPAIPCGSLQKRVDNALPGATLQLPACVFREHVVIDKPIRLVGQPGTEIRGSDVWDDWEAAGPLWRSRNRMVDDPALRCRAVASGEDSNDRVCWSFEQVHIDGQRLWPAKSGRTPNANEFALDGERHVLLARPPDGHTVEVTQRLRWATIASSNVVITQVNFRHALVGGDGGAVVTARPVRNIGLEQNTFYAAGGHAVVLSADEVDVRQNVFSESGGAALVLVDQGRSRVVGNTFDSNGRGHRRDNGWVVAGVKAIVARVDLLDNTFVNNAGIGAYLVYSGGSVVSQNRFESNAGAGVIAIGSHDTRISDNAFVRNGWGFVPQHPALWITQSHAVQTSDNKFAFHARAIAVDVLRGEDVPFGFEPCRASAWNRIENNLLFASGHQGVFMTGDPRPSAQIPPCSSNHIVNNRVWAPETGNQTAAAETGLAPMAHEERDAMLASLGLL